MTSDFHPDRTIAMALMRTTVKRFRSTLAALVVVAGPAVADAAAQSVTERPPNLGGTWVGTPGTLHFNFLHRFTVGDAPARKVTSFPTFMLAAGAPGRTLFGVRYATNSQNVVPNEWEVFGRWNPLDEARGAPLDVAIHAGWNQAAESGDVELSAGRTIGPLRILAAGRAFSDAYGSGESRYAIGGGATVHLNRWFALAGDVTALTDRDDDAGEKVAWGAGLQIAIPYTPHSLSLQVTNTNTGTLQGSSIGSDTRRYGFEFTIPVTLARYFGRGGAGGPGTTPENPLVVAGDTVRIVMDRIMYETPYLVVSPGTTVIWVNDDDVVHTATANDGAWDSGFIPPGQSWARTFDRQGEHAYHCIPHPNMVGTIVVR
jgi:plastocyanin